MLTSYQLHIAVQDDASEKIRSANQFIEVPNLAKNRLALSRITLGNFTPEDWQPIQSSADSVDPAKVKNDTAVRSFKRGSVLSFSCTAYDAALDKISKQPNLQTRFRLLRDGKVVLEGDPKAVNLEGEKDLARIRINSAILLGNQMPEGEYVL